MNENNYEIYSEKDKKALEKIRVDKNNQIIIYKCLFIPKREIYCKCLKITNNKIKHKNMIKLFLYN